jgi:LmbE family N-acetylglucosaminyl deacetylase
MNQLTLLAVFAHPDDEAFGVGGTLAKYAAEGAAVHLVSATRGEAGQIRDPSLASKANLPQVREQELRCACRAYGIHPPRFLDYVDGQLAIVHQGQAVGKLVRIIRELKPQVIITFGPEGIYGHYDHIAVHRWATIAFDLAADASCFPEQPGSACAVHQVSKLYYAVVPEETVAWMSQGGRAGSVMMDDVPFPMVGYRRDQITTVIDIGAYLEAKMRGLACHATQFDATSVVGERQQSLSNPLMGQETFILGRSTMGQPALSETDLFVGSR